MGNVGSKMLATGASSAGGSAAAWALGMLLAGAEVEVRAWRRRAGGNVQHALALRGAAHMARSARAPPRRAAGPAQAKPASARARPAADAQHEPAAARPMRDNLLLRLLDLEDEHAALGAKHEKAICVFNIKLEDQGAQLASAEAAWADAEAARITAERKAAAWEDAEAARVAAEREAAAACAWAAGMQRELHAKLAAADVARAAAQHEAAVVRAWAADGERELLDLRRQLAEERAGRAAAEEAATNTKAYLAFMRATACGAATY